MSLPEQLDALLGKLKSAIRRYVLLRGLAWLASALVVVFWVTLLIDTVWFQVTRLELPRESRVAILVIGVVVLAAVLMQGLIWQLLVQLRRKALALLLEKRFPQLNDRLITVVEVAEESEQGSRADSSQPLPVLSQTMLDRTIRDAVRLMESLKVEEVFNPRPLRTAFTVAVVALVSLAATAVASPATFSHWSNAYLQLADEYWNREHGLQVFVLAQPGDRIRPFEKNICKHAAGSDLTILVSTVEGKQTPPRVLLNYRTAAGARGRALMTPSGDGKFRHTIGNLVDNLEFTLTGGDFTTPRPYFIVTTPEPQVESLVANCEYPEYTGWNAPDVGEERLQRIVSSELTVPMETRLDLRGTVTKPLVGARIVGREFELQIRRDAASGEISSMYRQLDERGLAAFQAPLVSEDQPLISADGLSLSLPFHITATASQGTQPLNENGDAADEEDNSTAVDSAANSASASSEPLSRLTVRESEMLRIYLEDADGIVSLEPARVQLNGRPDESPVVQTRLAGIGKAITRRAVMPFRGEITDDYGIEETYFEYRVGDDKEPRRQPTARQPRGERQFAMERTGDQPLERFDVLPLELKVDDVLTVSLVARDGDTVNGPHITRGETYRMKIVSEEALLSLLYQDELNLRRRFEQVIEEITRARDDMRQASGATGENATSLVSEAVQRSLNTVQKDAVETDAILAAFESIREELVNNRVETPQIRNRLEGKIIQPLRDSLQNEWETTEEHLRLLDFSLRRNESTPVTVDQCEDDLEDLLASLARILLEMRKLESFQEMIEQLKGLIEDQKSLKQKTEDERKKRLIDLLN